MRRRVASSGRRRVGRASRTRGAVAALLLVASIGALVAIAPTPPAPPPHAPVDDAAVRTRALDEAVIAALRQEFYFSDRIRDRLDDKKTLASEVRAAAKHLGWSDAEGRAEVHRIDSSAGRTALKALLPEQDNAVVVGALVRANLIRASVPLSDEPRLSPEAKKRAVNAALRLLKEQMALPGGDAIWGKVDTELDRKIRSLVASRTMRPEKRPWCEFAAWTMLAQGESERALGLAEKSEKLMADAKLPPSADFVAVRAIALKNLKRTADAAAAAAELGTIDGASADLKKRAAPS